jgi:hypothetical protein
MEGAQSARTFRARFLLPPEPPQQKHKPDDVANSALNAAVDTVPLIRQLWQDEYGLKTRHPDDGASAEEIAAVQAFIGADARLPKEVSLPRPVHREVARILEERREFPVVDVIEAIEAFGQPELLTTKGRQVDLQTIKGQTTTQMLVAPLPMNIK